MKRNFFIDFDGTITLKDSCFAMINQFCHPGWQDINQLWEQDELGTIECARQTFALFNTSLEELVPFLKSIPVDPYFKDFMRIVQERGDKIFILSDGYDLCINTILDKNEINGLQIYCNRLLYTGERFDLLCPYHNENCGKCGTCKTTLLHKLKEEGTESIYIGDGTSDRCPVKHADLIFAKKKLFQYCNKNELPVKEFDSFQDIINCLYF